MKISTSGPAQAAATAIDKSPLPPINPEAEVPDNEDLGFSRPKTSNVTRSPRKLPKGPALCDVSSKRGGVQNKEMEKVNVYVVEN